MSLRTERDRVLLPVNLYWHAYMSKHRVCIRVNIPRKVLHSLMLRVVSIAPGQVTRAGCRPLAVAPLTLSASCQGSDLKRDSWWAVRLETT